MANVHKCDICGSIYEKPREPQYHGCFMVYGQQNDDTCPNCTERIMGFIDSLRAYGSDSVGVIIKDPQTPWYEVPEATEATNEVK